jgi:phosphoribosylformylglycinamidine (FGAM) synthase PurS component
VTTVREVRVGRRVELTIEAATEADARQTVERLAHDLFGNPLIETTQVDMVEAASSIAMGEP